MPQQTEAPTSNRLLHLHGTLIALRGEGLLITGPPGSGKSSLALSLIDRSHRLVADDAPLFRTEQQRLIGRCPVGFEGQLHLQGIGIFHLPCHPGEIDVRMVLALDPQATAHPEVGLLDGLWDKLEVGGIRLPRLTLNPALCANLTLTTEYCFTHLSVPSI